MIASSLPMLHLHETDEARLRALLARLDSARQSILSARFNSTAAIVGIALRFGQIVVIDPEAVSSTPLMNSSEPQKSAE